VIEQVAVFETVLTARSGLLVGVSSHTEDVYRVASPVFRRLHYFSKTGEDSRGLEGTPGDSRRRGNPNVFMSQKPKSFAIIGLVFTGNKGSIPAASTNYFFFLTVVLVRVPGSS
jgi:hypothetical protein